MEKISFLGTGLMGEPMAHRVLDAGYDIMIYNRTLSKTESLKAKGASVTQFPSVAVEYGNVLISMLSDYPSICEVFSHAASRSFKNKTLIMMSTIAPGESVMLENMMKNVGGEYLEAPVLGSIPAARSGTLVILLGGRKSLFDKWDSLLAHMGDKRYFIGEIGKASALKLAFNHLSIELMSAFSMSLGFVRESGADIDMFMDILRQTPMYAQNYDKKLDNLIHRDFTDSNFPVRLLLKDANLIRDAFRKAEINTLPLDAILEIIKKSIEQGDAEKDYSAIYNIIHPIKKDSVG
jgi:3-hydroxyisobutyrate dehydrogenase